VGKWEDMAEAVNAEAQRVKLAEFGARVLEILHERAAGKERARAGRGGYSLAQWISVTELHIETAARSLGLLEEKGG
jgi:hypothetical protein